MSLEEAIRATSVCLRLAALVGRHLGSRRWRWLVKGDDACRTALRREQLVMSIERDGSHGINMMAVMS